jgi:hypothetical protein
MIGEDMAGLAHKERRVDYPVSSEARTRIDDARVRDLAFHIRSFLAPRSIDSADLNAIALVVVRGLDESARVDKGYVIKRLMEAGRSKRKAEDLASSLFK